MPGGLPTFGQLAWSSLRGGLFRGHHTSVVSLKYLYTGCADFGFWRGATREHPPKWGCDRGATKPEPKSGAPRRAACPFGSDFVVRSSQIAEGYARRSRLV